ncbi:hypothetical protein MBLNU230_g1408t1 [Neophaeotheca triangularis]
MSAPSSNGNDFTEIAPTNAGAIDDDDHVSMVSDDLHTIGEETEGNQRQKRRREDDHTEEAPPATRRRVEGSSTVRDAFLPGGPLASGPSIDPSALQYPPLPGAQLPPLQLPPTLPPRRRAAPPPRRPSSPLDLPSFAHPSATARMLAPTGVVQSTPQGRYDQPTMSSSAPRHPTPEKAPPAFVTPATHARASASGPSSLQQSPQGYAMMSGALPSSTIHTGSVAQPPPLSTEMPAVTAPDLHAGAGAASTGGATVALPPEPRPESASRPSAAETARPLPSLAAGAPVSGSIAAAGVLAPYNPAGPASYPQRATTAVPAGPASTMGGFTATGPSAPSAAPAPPPSAAVGPAAGSAPAPAAGPGTMGPQTLQLPPPSADQLAARSQPVPAWVQNVRRAMLDLPVGSNDYPLRAYIERDPILRPHFLRARGTVKRTSELRRWIGDTRVFTTGMWYHLTQQGRYNGNNLGPAR